MTNQTYDHAWNQGLLSGIHFACKELNHSKEMIQEIQRRWLQSIQTQSKDKK